VAYVILWVAAQGHVHEVSNCRVGQKEHRSIYCDQ